jgi:hypothetical protein
MFGRISSLKYLHLPIFMCRYLVQRLPLNEYKQTRNEYHHP